MRRIEILSKRAPSGLKSGMTSLPAISTMSDSNREDACPYPLPFGRDAESKPPFQSDPHYDAKAWELCATRKGPGRVLSWNVAGPAQP
jgi:hypothetical protein